MTANATHDRSRPKALGGIAMASAVDGEEPSRDQGGVPRRVRVVGAVTDGNDERTDSATFSLGFDAERCRHDDGSGRPSFDNQRS